MKISLAAATALSVLLTVPVAASAATDAAVLAELEGLRGQVVALLQRVEQLEQSQAAAATVAAPAPADAASGFESRLAAIEETNDRQTDQLAHGLASSSAMDWARRIRWKGDLRYRHEQFDVEGAASDRVRHRLRGRFGVDAKVSDSIAVGFQIATGEGRDARSTNSTLDSANQHEEIGLDLAYVDWAPRPGVLVTLGKQKQPWFKAGNSLFFDGDVNPEGAAFLYGGKTGLFVRAWGYWLEEMSGGADSNLLGAQLGYAFDNGLTVATGYWDYGAIQDQPALAFAGSPAGNSSYAAAADCVGAGVPRCYTYDYNVAIADLQWTGTLGSRPLALFAGYMENLDPDELNTGYNFGFVYGKASDPHSWEFGAMYQDVERDAQLGAFLDSDFADGATQGRGVALSGAWAPVKNVNLKATWFINERNYDTPAEADYERLQLDLNYMF
jgi:hypothetical protein